MRRVSVLLGVAVVASSAGVATHFALCDRRGEPACGNIGQRGATNVTFNAPVIEVATAPADALVARPLVDESGDPAPGNVMRKGK